MRKRLIFIFITLIVGCIDHLSAQEKIFISVIDQDHEQALTLINKTSKKKLTTTYYYGVPLMTWVTMFGDTNCVKAMIDKGVNTTIGGFFLNSNYYISPLIVAVVKRDLVKIRLLLDHGADPNFSVEGQEMTALNYAFDSFIDAVPMLVDAGADINKSLSSSMTPLQNSITNHYPEMAIWLMDRGADINEGMPLMTAISFKEFDVAVELIRRGARLDASIGQGSQASPLWLFLLNSGNPEVLRALDSKNISVNSKIFGDFSPLMLLSGEQGKLSTVQWLVHHGADVNARTSFGMHVLQFAVNSGSYDIVKTVIDAGAVTNDTPDGYRDPVIDAINRQADTLLPLLLQDRKVSFRVDWLLQAFRSGREAPISSLMARPDAEKYINVPNKAGYTAFLAAVASGSLRTVKNLMPYAPDTSYVGPDGMKGLEVARKFGYRSIVDYLLDPEASTSDSLHPENWYSTVRFMFDYSNHPDTLALTRISDQVLGAIDYAFVPGSYANLQHHFQFSNRLMNSPLTQKAIASFRQTLQILRHHNLDFSIGPLDSVYMESSILLSLGNLYSRIGDKGPALTSFLASKDILENHSEMIDAIVDYQAKTMYYQIRFYSIVNLLVADTENRYSEKLFPDLVRIIDGTLKSSDGNLIGTPQQMMFNSELVSLFFNSPTYAARTSDLLMNLGASLSQLMNDFTFLDRSEQAGFLNRLYYDTYVLCNLLNKELVPQANTTAQMETLLQSYEERQKNVLSAFSFILATKSARLESETSKRRFIRDRGTAFINSVYAQREYLYDLGGSYLSQGRSAPDQIYRKYYEYEAILNNQLKALMYQDTDKFNASSFRSKLKEDEALIEFISFPLLGTENEGELYYAALVLRHSSEGLKFIPLGEHSLVDSLTNLLYRTIEAPRGTIIKGVQSIVPFDSVMAQFYRVIWSPLQPELQGITKLIISPDRQLSRVPFAALVLTDGTYLIDHYGLRILQTSKALLEPTRISFDANTRMNFFGDMNFTLQQVDRPNEIAQSYREFYKDDFNLDHRSARNGEGNHVYWKKLPGTRLEYETLKQVCGSSLNFQAILGDSALEETFKMQNKNAPEIIHIATHGYYYTAGMDSNEHRYYQNSTEPLMRSGLVFSGANDTLGDQREDGILTAFEIGSLDLSNTALVSLSACETGLGDVSGSEGTLGLQRAFKMAGVSYIIQTLWEIPDKGPEEFFGLFYDFLLRDHQEINAAFNATVRAIQDKYPDRPELWAGFVLIE